MEQRTLGKILLYPLSGGRDVFLGKEKLGILKPFLPIPAKSALRFHTRLLTKTRMSEMMERRVDTARRMLLCYVKFPSWTSKMPFWPELDKVPL